MPQGYISFKEKEFLPRIPLEGQLDFTYRCNNSCRHCWTRLPPDAPEGKNELSCDEIINVCEEARKMGCQKWNIFGGEPMLRPDFPELFDYLTRRAVSYTINTNATLITPRIAALMKRRGVKLVALYGATANTHDHITRNPGSFEATMRGFRYLKEAGTGFMVQIVPMRDNYQEYPQMVRLAESLSRHWRIGASWLFLSADGNTTTNKEICRQRLPAVQAVEFDIPDTFIDKRRHISKGKGNNQRNGALFSACALEKNSFSVDPYGKLTFCHMVKEPTLLYDIKKGSFREYWNNFLPCIANKVKASADYYQGCGGCRLRDDCLWCPAKSYLEHRNFFAPVTYLCSLAQKKRALKQRGKRLNVRYYQAAGITIEVESRLPFKANTLQPYFRHFRVECPSAESASLKHYFSLPDLKDKDLGIQQYRKPPWAIYQKNGSWIYLGISAKPQDKSLHCLAVFNRDYSRGRIYHRDDKQFLRGRSHSLSLLSSDEVFLAPLLAERQGCFVHGLGIDFAGKGLLFPGHSGEGKSTLAMMLKGRGRILSDERIAVRKQPQGFQIYGTWNHSRIKELSAGPSRLKAILFLQKSKRNYIQPLKDKKAFAKGLLSYVIKPFITKQWWEKTLFLIEGIIEEVPFYQLYFGRRQEAVTDVLQDFFRSFERGGEV